ncbi:MAG: hypothetical protein ABW043_21990 [Devosia sp.]
MNFPWRNCIKDNRPVPAVESGIGLQLGLPGEIDPLQARGKGVIAFREAVGTALRLVRRTLLFGCHAAGEERETADRQNAQPHADTPHAGKLELRRQY